MVFRSVSYRIVSDRRVCGTVIHYLLWTAIFGLTSTVTGESPQEIRAYEAHSGLGMVASGSPEATEAAVAVLERGGNAVDAAVAASFVLGVADSDASGLGGSTYMVVRLANGRAVAIDGTARIPMYIDLDGFNRAHEEGRRYGHELIAVPTTLAVLDFALNRYGTISLKEALDPAIDLAANGYRLSSIQAAWTKRYRDEIIASSAYLSHLVMEDGETVGQPGDLICNHDLANTLRLIALHGPDTFYRGEIASRMERDILANGGSLRKTDLAMLRIRERPPAKTTYRGTEVLSVPAPGGGETLAEALNILETFPKEFLKKDSLERHHTFIEAIRIAIADRANSGAGMLQGNFLSSATENKIHARERAELITPGRVFDISDISAPIDPECLPTSESTTHVSIIDLAGNAVSLTQSLGRSYGAKVATPGLGFPYNNFLGSFQGEKPHCPGFLRPRGLCGNDMAPTILVRNGYPVVVLGTPGSNRIPSILAGIISNLIDREMSLHEAVSAPRIVWGGISSINIEAEVGETITDSQLDALDEMEYEHPAERSYLPDDPMNLIEFGGVNAVSADFGSGTFIGIVDHRRGGLAAGPRVVGSREQPATSE
jgi:gamma-glutamyltranspeptidase/glutathione hydrolase